MDIKARQMIESQIIKKILQNAIELGYTVTLGDGYEIVISQSTNVNAILAATRSTDSDILTFHTPGILKSFGFVELIYGNSGWGVIADCTDSPRIREILRYAEYWADRCEAQYS